MSFFAKHHVRQLSQFKPCCLGFRLRARYFHMIGSSPGLWVSSPSIKRSRKMLQLLSLNYIEQNAMNSCTLSIIPVFITRYVHFSFRDYRDELEVIGRRDLKLDAAKLHLHSLPESNMETQKGPFKDSSPLKMGLYGFPC